jgi:hypothetical protein
LRTALHRAQTSIRSCGLYTKHPHGAAYIFVPVYRLGPSTWSHGSAMELAFSRTLLRGVVFFGMVALRKASKRETGRDYRATDLTYLRMLEVYCAVKSACQTQVLTYRVLGPHARLQSFGISFVDFHHGSAAISSAHTFLCGIARYISSSLI